MRVEGGGKAANRFLENRKIAQIACWRKPCAEKMRVAKSFWTVTCQLWAAFLARVLAVLLKYTHICEMENTLKLI